MPNNHQCYGDDFGRQENGQQSENKLNKLPKLFSNCLASHLPNVNKAQAVGQAFCTIVHGQKDWIQVAVRKKEA